MVEGKKNLPGETVSTVRMEVSRCQSQKPSAY